MGQSAGIEWLARDEAYNLSIISFEIAGKHAGPEPTRTQRRENQLHNAERSAGKSGQDYKSSLEQYLQDQ